ncbi:hypothetical protein IAD21_01553 [Abditibacteriota bacterium]|nr:hypothetical protein IAD21_01553 [Abditibacteriota bacterium]
MKSLRFKHSFLFVPTIAGIAFGALLCRPASADFLLQPNDRVVFYGDSITDFHNYTRPFQDYVYARYPERHIHFYNAGWSGDQASGALRRLDRDVMVLNPTVVTLCFGMNDGHYQRLSDEIVNTYRTNMDGIVKALTEKGIRVIVFSPPPVDYDKQPPWLNYPLTQVDYNATLAALGDAGSEVAKKYGATYIDILHPILTAHAALKAKDPAYTWLPDAVHPDEKGGVVMAGAMLLGMGAEPMPPLADVSANQLAPDGKVPSTGPSRLPMWMNSESAIAARESGFLNVAGQRVRVRGLAPGTYDVKINGQSAGWFTHTQLEAGALIPGTYSTRAQRLYDVAWWKEGNYFNIWRNLRIGSEQGPPIEAAIASLMKSDDAYNDAIEALNAPIPSLVITVQATGLPANIGPNLALKKPYTASDPNVYDFGIGNLTNGVWEGQDMKPFATGEKDTFPKNATIDLGKVTPISTILLGVPPFGSTKTVTVSISSDGQNFTEVGSYVFSLNKEERHVYSFAATPARYVRLTYPDHYPDFVGYTPTFTFTSEAEVYGPAQ